MMWCTGRGDDLRFDVHRLLVVRQPPTRQDLLPHTLGSRQKRRVIVKGQQIGEKVVFAGVEQHLAIEFRLLDTGAAFPIVGQSLQQGARLRCGLWQGHTVLRSDVWSGARHAVCIGSLLQLLLVPPLSRRLPSSLLALYGLPAVVTCCTTGGARRAEQDASECIPRARRHGAVKAFCLNTLDKSAGHEGGAHAGDTT